MFKAFALKIFFTQIVVYKFLKLELGKVEMQMSIKQIRRLGKEREILSYKEVAEILYRYIKEVRRIPYTNVKVSRVELRQDYGVLVGTSIGIKKIEGTKYCAKWRVLGDLRDAIEVAVKKGVVILYTNEPWRDNNIAIVVYAE